MKNLKLKQKVLISMIIILFTTSVSSIVYFAYFINSNFEMQEDRRVGNIGNFINFSLANAIWNFDQVVYKTISKDVLRHNNLNEIVIYNDKDKLIYSIGYKNGEFIDENAPVKTGISKQFQLNDDETGKKLGYFELYYSNDSIKKIVSTFNIRQSLVFLIQFITAIVLMYIILHKLVIKPINMINKALFEISEGEGDLTQRITHKAKDETGELAENFNRFVDRIENLIRSIEMSASQVLTSSNEVSKGNNTLSSVTQEMAGALEETSATLDEVANSVKHTSTTSEKTAEEVNSTTLEAEKSVSMVKDMESAMIELTKSGDKIANIVEVVNEIAFQTNLLSLNAAVEAAHAGEKGKGFTVVAREVRSLAARSSTAATEIRELIESNKEFINNSINLSRLASKALIDLGTRVKQINVSVDNINKLAHTEAQSISQINTTIGQIDESTQKNAALVEQVASLTEELVSVSRTLSSGISKFKISENSVTKSYN